MTLTTTPGIDGKPIGRYLGIVTGEAIVGAADSNAARTIFLSMFPPSGCRQQKGDDSEEARPHYPQMGYASDLPTQKEKTAGTTGGLRFSSDGEA